MGRRSVEGCAVFIVPQPRYGGIRVTGTPTGRVYEIGNRGAWVHVDDEADVLDRQKHTQCCGVVKPFDYGVPSAKQVLEVPDWAYLPVPEPKPKASERTTRKVGARTRTRRPGRKRVKQEE